MTNQSQKGEEKKSQWRVGILQENFEPDGKLEEDELASGSVVLPKIALGRYSY